MTIVETTTKLAKQISNRFFFHFSDNRIKIFIEQSNSE